MAEALLDGSTPPAAAPLLVGMLQEGLRAAEVAGQEAATQLSEQDRVRTAGREGGRGRGLPSWCAAHWAA